MPPMVLSKSFHFPARPLCLLIGSLQRFKRKEKIISDIWNQLKWLSVENANILRSLDSVIKWSPSSCKERFALKWFLRQREIRLFLPRRKILLNPYMRLPYAQSGDIVNAHLTRWTSLVLFLHFLVLLCKKNSSGCQSDNIDPRRSAYGSSESFCLGVEQNFASWQK